MTWRLALSLILLVAVAPCRVSAAEVSVTAEEPLTEVKSVELLPRALQEALGRFKTGLGGFADRNEPFNVSDAIHHSAPRRRFAIGGVNSQRALVCFEYGGFRYGMAVLAFDRVGEQWKLRDEWPLSRISRVEELSLDEVLQRIPPAGSATVSSGANQK